ncbi:MAG TPA: adenylate/guanylate cyclase domain-containing protein [Acidimicrobiia bacterium]
MPVGDVPQSVIQLLHDLGANDEEIESASAINRLPALAVDYVLARDFALTVDDVAEHFGTRPESIVEIYRLLGVTLDRRGRVLGTNDIALLDALSIAGTRRLGTGDEANLSQDAGENLLRVIGASVGRIADAAVSTFIQDVESQLQVGFADIDTWVRAETQIGEVAHQVAPGLGTLFIHHLIDAIRRQRVTQDGTAPDRLMARLGVGFVDLVGFTPLSLHISAADLVKLVTRFEQRAFDITTTHDGRVVKHIGDEVMYAALTADDAAEIALDLLAEFAGDVQPRGGLCFGEALTLRGDYYGPVVNLAARLVDEAVPGEVLIDVGTAALLQRVQSEPAGRRLLKGFDEPISVCSLTV